MDVDLFGHPLESVDWVERWLGHRDRESFAGRVRRLKRTVAIYPEGRLAMPSQSYAVFSEARSTYVNGDFASTLMVSQAFIEHRLQHWLIGQGEARLAARGLKAILTYCRSHKVLDSVVLDGMDRLRRRRNPFTHSRPFDDPDSLMQRVLSERTDPVEIMEDEAFRALALMLTIATVGLPGDAWPFPNGP